MATTKLKNIETTPKPLIQIDDLIREMTDEEFDFYNEMTADSPQLPGPTE
jgi:hypothetical protein